ncbi:MAG: hypothetical protein AAB263_10855, partial [Planctomycetota bacterium]
DGHPPGADRGCPQSHDGRRAARKLQRNWSRTYDQHTLAERFRQAGGGTLRGKARLNSCAASHQAVSPLVDKSETFELPWVANAQLVPVMRQRLGLDIYTAERPCRICRGNATSDVAGVHASSCMSSGQRMRLHHQSRDQLVRIAGMALCAPRREANCFPADPRRRCDVLLSSIHLGGMFANRFPIAVDYACIDALGAGHIQQAAHRPAGAATAYEEVKRHSYAEIMRGAEVTLVPMIQDSFGALGASSQVLLSHLARCIAARSGEPRSTVMYHLRTAFQAAHFRRWGALLCYNGE